MVLLNEFDDYQQLTELDQLKLQTHRKNAAHKHAHNFAVNNHEIQDYPSELFHN
jgi:hypothetical protein